jgi:glycosyltransferase involved in cell wall biosynthesis/spore maturation protein CgeB
MTDDKWRILLLDTKGSNPNHYIMIAIEEALRNHSSVESVVSSEYSDAVNGAIRQRCNLFFAFDGEGLDRGLCQRVSAVCGKSILWVTDDPYEIRVNTRNSEIFDHVFTNDSGSVNHYPNAAHHLPFAASQRFHFYEVPSQDEGHYFYDLLFVGTAWPNRVRLLKSLISGFQGLKIKLALPHNEHVPVPDVPLPRSSYQWKAANSELARLANRSRIVLTLHRDFSSSGKDTRASTPGPRLFETALSGGFQLADLMLPQVSEYFDLEKEIAGFSTEEDCLSKINYYLANPRERLAMARASQTKCIAKHLYQHRITEMFETIAASEPRRRNGSAPNSGKAGRKTRILYVVHNVVGVGSYGGVEIYLDVLARSLSEEYEPFIYYPDWTQPNINAMVFVNVRTKRERRRPYNGEFDPFSLMDTEWETWFARLLHEERIDLVHIHHLLGHPWSLPLVARTLGIPVVMTTHDYFTVCSRLNLLDGSHQYCRIPELPPSTCDLCLYDQEGVSFGSQSSRRSFVSAVLEHIDYIVFVSQAERKIFESIYPELRKKSNVCVEGVPVADRPTVARSSALNKILRVAVHGNFNRLKGGDTLCSVFEVMRHDAVEFHVYGKIELSYARVLSRLGASNVYIHGGYLPDSLHDRLSESDVSLLLSIWPETYVLTLSESWRAGLVPIVTDIGALGERVKHRVNGFKVPVGSPASVVSVLRELIADRTELERIRGNIHSGDYRKLGEHLDVITGIYRRLIVQYGITERSESYFREAPDVRPASASSIFRNHQTWLTMSGRRPRAWRPSILMRAMRYIEHYGFREFVHAAVRTLLQRKMG